MCGPWREDFRILLCLQVYRGDSINDSLHNIYIYIYIIYVWYD